MSRHGPRLPKAVLGAFSPAEMLARRPGYNAIEHRESVLPRGGADLIVSCHVYTGGQRCADLENSSDIAALMQIAKAQGGFVWIGLWEPTDDEFAHIADQFDLPPLAVEDAISAHQRPKLESYGSELAFAIIKPVHYIDHDEVVEVAEVAVFVGRHFVVTVRHGRSDIPAQARAILEADPERLAGGPGAVLHQITDLAVDEYLSAMEAIEVDIDEIEAQVFGGDQTDHSKRIYKLKREVLEFRRAATPLVAPLYALSQDAHRFGLTEDHQLLFGDVHDHALRAAESIESFNDLLTDVLQAELAQVSVRQSEVASRQNEDMRKISAWAAIGLVPTAFAGIYGMNFDNMPELHWRYGYFALLALIVGTCFGLYLMFRKNGWL